VRRGLSPPAKPPWPHVHGRRPRTQKNLRRRYAAHVEGREGRETRLIQHVCQLQDRQSPGMHGAAVSGVILASVTVATARRGSALCTVICTVSHSASAAWHGLSRPPRPGTGWCPPSQAHGRAICGPVWPCGYHDAFRPPRLNETSPLPAAFWVFSTFFEIRFKIK
jgi:hypothetical protein